MITVLARIITRSGQRAAFLEEFARIVPLVHQEAGCIEYAPMIDAETSISTQIRAGDDVVVIVEKWDSAEALGAHLVAPHMTDYRQRVKDLVITTEIFILEAPPAAA